MLSDLSKILPHPKSANTESPKLGGNPLAIPMTLPALSFPATPTEGGVTYSKILILEDCES